MNQTVVNYYDGYCERAGDPAFWGEPLNAVTNLFFILAAIMAARVLVKVPGDKKTDMWLMVVFLFLIGVGSGIWHTLAGHTVMLDVIPITLFINLYLISSLRRLFKLNWWKVGVYWFAYFAAGMLAQILLPPDLLNGTIMYIPTFVTLVILTIALQRRYVATAKTFAIVLGVWSLSLVFRTIDMDICPHFHFGTHFLWHTLNAWVLWRLAVTLMLHRDPAATLH